MPFDAATLALVEDALSEGFKFHAGLDSFLTRSGVSEQMLDAARSKAEARNANGGRFSKAPKRFVVQELLANVGKLGSKGDPIIANIVTGLTKAKFPDASETATSAIESLNAKIKIDQQEQKEKQQTDADRQRQSARLAERLQEVKRAKRQAERDGLRDRFIGLMAEANAQRRGYLLETFLNDLFEYEGLDPRGSFKLIGEQIDGSFAWRGRTALVEAKWTKDPSAGVDFGAFSYKIEGKTADTRGLFVSINGYSTDADVTPSFPPAGIRAGRLFCACARLKQWAAQRSP